MPLQIKELHIKAVIGSDSKTNAQSVSMEQPEMNQEAIIAACVEQVIQIMKDKMER